MSEGLQRNQAGLLPEATVIGPAILCRRFRYVLVIRYVIEFSLSKLSSPASTEAQLGTPATAPLMAVLFAINHVRPYSEPVRTSDARLLQNPLPLISQQVILGSFCVSGTDFSKSYSRSAPGLGLLSCERKNYSSPLLAEIRALSPRGP